MVNRDYRALCVELFGTDNVKELRKIAQGVNKKNPRNAGRKKKFRPEELRELQALVADGMTVNEAAERFHTSRQIIGKYLNEKPPAGYTLRMTYMYRQHPCTIIDVDFLNRKVLIQNRTKDPLHRAFGVIEAPSWDDFEVFLKERCFPVTRGNVKDVLRELQLSDYDPLQIVEKTHGRTAEDDMWLRFQYYPRGGVVVGQNQS